MVLTEAYLANGLLQWVFEYIGLITKVNKCQNERMGYLCMRQDAHNDLFQRNVAARLDRSAIPKLHNGYAMDN